MLTQKKMDRINALAKKAKEEGLTSDEQKEQAELRSEYIQSFRSSIRKTIENIRIYDAEGEDVTPDKVKNIQSQKKYH